MDYFYLLENILQNKGSRIVKSFMVIAVFTVLCLLLSPDFKNNSNYYQQAKNVSDNHGNS